MPTVIGIEVISDFCKHRTSYASASFTRISENMKLQIKQFLELHPFTRFLKSVGILWKMDVAESLLSGINEYLSIISAGRVSPTSPILALLKKILDKI